MSVREGSAKVEQIVPFHSELLCQPVEAAGGG